MTRLASRFQQVTRSATLDINERVAELRARGVTVHDLGLGEADYPTPRVVTDGLDEVRLTRMSRYTEVAGTAFGADRHVRLSFVRPVAELELACDALEHFVNSVRS